MEKNSYLIKIAGAILSNLPAITKFYKKGKGKVGEIMQALIRHVFNRIFNTFPQGCGGLVTG